MLSTKIARRYLFAKRDTNAINVITDIAVGGIAIGSAALLLVLSVFNGFEDLINDMYSSFNPDIKIEAAEGKTFLEDSLTIEKLYEHDDVQLVSRALQEIAVFEYKANKDFGIIKGVDSNFQRVSGLDSVVREGSYVLSSQEDRTYALLGLGMRNKLAVNVDDIFTPLNVYTPKRKVRSPTEQMFRFRRAYPAGTFIVQQNIDNEYVITTLDFVRELMRLPDQLSSLEVKLRYGADSHRAQQEIQALMGDAFSVKNRYQQEESILKLMQIEKWLSYAIVSLMMLMVAFNLIGALWMIVLEKRPSIAILRSMGATSGSIHSIFMQLGILLTGFGVICGMTLAVLLYVLQKSVGIISVPGDFMTEAYPMSLRFVDFVVVAVTVLTIGGLASLIPARRARRVPAIIHED